MTWLRGRRSGDSTHALAQARAVEADLREVLGSLRAHLDELEAELSGGPAQFVKGAEDA